MNWTDEALVLSVRDHGETAAIAELFTRGHGRHLGLVHGGRSRKLRPQLQIGNHIDVSWKGRLPEHLGHLGIELRRAHAATAMDDAAALACLGSLSGLLRLLPERDPHPSLFEITLFVLSYLDDPAVWPALVPRWELRLLEEFGFGLDLTACAATGATTGLTHVSPKSGRAVSAEAAKPYAGRLLPLPAFLIEARAAPGEGDLAAGLSLTAYFIESRLLRPRDLAMPDARVRLPNLLKAL